MADQAATTKINEAKAETLPAADAVKAPVAVAAAAPKAISPEPVKTAPAAPAKAAVPAKAEAKPARKPRKVRKTAKKPAAVRTIKAKAKAKPARPAAKARTITKPARAGIDAIKTGAKTMNTQTRKAAEAAQTAADQIKTVFGDVNARAKTAMEKNAKIAEELAELARGNVEALPGLPDTPPWTVLEGDDEATRFYAGAAEIGSIAPIPRTTATISRPAAPGLWVVLRPTGRRAAVRGRRRHRRSERRRSLHRERRRSGRAGADARSGARDGRSLRRRAPRRAALHQAQAAIVPIRRRWRARRRGRRIKDGNLSEPENFLARWARRKREAAGPPDDAAPDEACGKASARRTSPTAHADGSACDEPAFDLSALPPIESITATTDIRAFLAPGVPAELTRAALRRAWVADPTIRDFVGIAENQWDFNDPAAIPGFGPLGPLDDVRRAGRAGDWRGCATSHEASKRRAAQKMSRLGRGQLIPTAAAKESAPTPVNCRSIVQQRPRSRRGRRGCAVQRIRCCSAQTTIGRRRRSTQPRTSRSHGGRFAKVNTSHGNQLSLKVVHSLRLLTRSRSATATF